MLINLLLPNHLLSFWDILLIKIIHCRVQNFTLIESSLIEYKAVKSRVWIISDDVDFFADFHV